jgi:NAD(P)-dependent dehydrogenase (short-subunit alcohol dehydrogenase family)
MEKNWGATKIPRLDGKRVIVTGANSGIGYHTALELGRAGAEVTVAARDRARGAEALARMQTEVPGGRFAVEELDLASLASIRAFAQRMAAAGRPLDILVNNAGIMALPARELTADGFERQLGTNHLGHFALAAQLLPLLRAAAAPRVVVVSSSVANWAKLDLDNLQSEKRYSPMGTYGQSKLANLLFMVELQRRGAGAGIVAVASHPGAAVTNLQVHKFKHLIKLIGQSAAMGALPSLYAAVGADVQSGEYYGPRKLFGTLGPPGPARLPRRALDPALAGELWARSEALTGVSFALDAAPVAGASQREDPAASRSDPRP